jgi:hypothetical protein
MTTLVLTRGGYDDIVNALGQVPPQLWVNADVLSENELSTLRAAGHDVTNFTKPIPLGDQVAISDAIQTIQGHHPLQRLWVEYPPVEF